jgi:hypothetical protein
MAGRGRFSLSLSAPTVAAFDVRVNHILLSCHRLDPHSVTNLEGKITKTKINVAMQNIPVDVGSFCLTQGSFGQLVSPTFGLLGETGHGE